MLSTTERAAHSRHLLQVIFESAVTKVNNSHVTEQGSLRLLTPVTLAPPVTCTSATWSLGGTYT